MELNGLWEEMRMGELSEKVDSLFPSLSLSLEKMLEMLAKGQFLELLRSLFREGLLGLLGDGRAMRELFLSLLLMGVTGAILAGFSDLWEKYRVSELSFYLTYFLQAAILARCHANLTQIARDAMEKIVLFVRLLMPSYLFAVGMSTGSLTASAGYQMTILLLYGVEELLQGIFVPLITCFFLITVLEGVMGQERMEYLADFLKKSLQWGMKGVLGLVAGLSFLQAVLTPALDRVKGSVLQKALAAVPGIGDGAEGVMQLFLGSATVIKNGVGIALTLLLLLLCLSPLWKLLSFSLLYKLTAGIMGLVSDKRITKAVDRAGDAGLLLFGVLGEAMLFFLMILAVTTASVR